MDQQKSIKAVWTDFIICFLFGIYGVHKFREKKIGLGILYLFTGGLLIFGWLYDCIKLLVIAVGTTLYLKKAKSDDTFVENSETLFALFSLAKKIALISIVVFLLFFIIVTACSPNTDIDSTPTTEATTEVTTETALETLIPTTEATTEPTTAPITEPTIAPTTKPVAEPTPKPTAEPTIAPTTKPTTESTIAPTTEPIIVPTTEPPHIHNFSAATCTTPKTCSCGATEGSTVSHNFVNGQCSYCGIVSETTPANNSSVSNSDGDPDNDDTDGSVVYKTPTGKRYHIDPNCGGSNSTQTTLSTAKKLGLTPCQKCVG